MWPKIWSLPATERRILPFLSIIRMYSSTHSPVGPWMMMWWSLDKDSRFKITSGMGCDGDIEKWLILCLSCFCKWRLKSDFENRKAQDFKMWNEITRRFCKPDLCDNWRHFWNSAIFFLIFSTATCQKVWLVQNGKRLHLENIVCKNTLRLCVCVGGGENEREEPFCWELLKY